MKRRTMGNLHAGEVPAVGETFEALLETPALLVERIVSSGNTEPASYDQDHDEWVVLLEGDAVLTVENERVVLTRGDWLLLPAGTPHTVEETSPGALWLAIHLRRSQ